MLRLPAPQRRGRTPPAPHIVDGTGPAAFCTMITLPDVECCAHTPVPWVRANACRSRPRAVAPFEPWCAPGARATVRCGPSGQRRRRGGASASRGHVPRITPLGVPGQNLGDTSRLVSLGSATSVHRFRPAGGFPRRCHHELRPAPGLSRPRHRLSRTTAQKFNQGRRSRQVGHLSQWHRRRSESWLAFRNLAARSDRHHASLARARRHRSA